MHKKETLQESFDNLTLSIYVQTGFIENYFVVH